MATKWTKEAVISHLKYGITKKMIGGRQYYSIAVFRDIFNARALAKRIREMGFNSCVVKFGSGGEVFARNKIRR